MKYMIACVALFGFWTWFFSSGDYHPFPCWPHFHHSTRIDESRINLALIKNLTTHEIKNGHAPAQWGDGLYKLK